MLQLFWLLFKFLNSFLSCVCNKIYKLVSGKTIATVNFPPQLLDRINVKRENYGFVHNALHIKVNFGKTLSHVITKRIKNVLVTMHGDTRFLE